MTFCVQSEEDAAVVSKRLDHMLGHMLRVLPDKRELTWRVAAMSRFHEPARAPQPFFITWDDPSIRPDKVRLHIAKLFCDLGCRHSQGLMCPSIDTSVGWEHGREISTLA